MAWPPTPIKTFWAAVGGQQPPSSQAVANAVFSAGAGGVGGEAGGAGGGGAAGTGS